MRYSATRREFLFVAGSGVVAGMAGCSESNADDQAGADDQPTHATETPESTPTATETSPPDETDPEARDDGEADQESDDGEADQESDDGEGDHEESDLPEIAMVTDDQGTYFEPKGLLVEPGTTVRFVNESGNHDSTAYHPDNGKPLRIPEEAEPWATELFTESGRGAEVTFDVEGVYDYCCTPHESMGMVGRIVVGEPHDGPGTSEPEDIPPGARESLPPVSDVLENGTVSGP